MKVTSMHTPHRERYKVYKILTGIRARQKAGKNRHVPWSHREKKTQG